MEMIQIPCQLNSITGRGHLNGGKVIFLVDANNANSRAENFNDNRLMRKPINSVVGIVIIAFVQWRYDMISLFIQAINYYRFVI